MYICCSYSGWLPLKVGAWTLNPSALPCPFETRNWGPIRRALHSSDVNAISSVVFRQAWCELSNLVLFLSLSWTLIWIVACSLWSSERWWMKAMVSMMVCSLGLLALFEVRWLLLQWWKHLTCHKSLGSLSRIKIFQEFTLTSLY